MSPVRPARERVLAGSTRSQQFRGFTLLETLVALVILAFALAGLTMLMIGNFETGREGRRVTAASAIAQQKIEDLRATGYATLSASASNSIIASKVNEIGVADGAGMFSFCYTVFADSPPSGVLNAWVWVTWSNAALCDDSTVVDTSPWPPTWIKSLPALLQTKITQ